ncbi:MAG: thioredoxin [Candidatus Gracilibacteria bacterium]|nr:thioredoxin [Candidatus Gracilibacteria bacterium]
MENKEIKHLTLEATDATFTESIAKGVSLVDFWAVWCGPCQVMIPRMDELAIKIGDKAKIMKMNVDENMVTPQSFGIRSIPTMILFKDGKAVEQFVGIQEVDFLVKKIEAQLV